MSIDELTEYYMYEYSGKMKYANEVLIAIIKDTVLQGDLRSLKKLRDAMVIGISRVRPNWKIEVVGRAVYKNLALLAYLVDHNYKSLQEFVSAPVQLKTDEYYDIGQDRIRPMYANKKTYGPAMTFLRRMVEEQNKKIMGDVIVDYMGEGMLSPN